MGSHKANPAAEEDSGSKREGQTKRLPRSGPGRSTWQRCLLVLCTKHNSRFGKRRPLNLLRWPTASPVTRSRVAHLPMHGNPQAPPKFLPAAPIPFFHMELDQLCHSNILQDPNLNHAAWLAAFAALTGTDLTSEHALIPSQFPSRVAAPLQAGNHAQVKEYVTEIISCTDPSWAIEIGRPRSSGSHTAPDDASIQVLPRSTQDALPSWVDKLYLKIAHLAALLSEAQDLPKSAAGWIKCSALRSYNGPSIPGNCDTHTGEIVCPTNACAFSGQPGGVSNS